MISHHCEHIHHCQAASNVCVFHQALGRPVSTPYWEPQWTAGTSSPQRWTTSALTMLPKTWSRTTCPTWSKVRLIYSMWRWLHLQILDYYAGTLIHCLRDDVLRVSCSTEDEFQDTVITKKWINMTAGRSQLPLATTSYWSRQVSVTLEIKTKPFCTNVQLDEGWSHFSGHNSCDSDEKV